MLYTLVSMKQMIGYKFLKLSFMSESVYRQTLCYSKAVVVLKNNQENEQCKCFTVD